MSRRFFLSGTDTDVGKSVVAAWLCSTLGLAYYKPVQCGLEHQDSQFIKKVTPKVKVHEPRFVLPLARAPYESQAIKVADILPFPDDPDLLVEGVGGLMVPFNHQETLMELIAKSGLSVILVARTTLGTLNHTLLSVEALRTKGIRLYGMVLVGQRDEPNQQFLQSHVKNTVHLPVLAELGEAEFAKHKATAQKLLEGGSAQ